MENPLLMDRFSDSVRPPRPLLKASIQAVSKNPRASSLKFFPGNEDLQLFFQI